MTTTRHNGSAHSRADAPLIWTVAFVSMGALAFEIALMRILLVASWHHFAFVVISVALLGFGASGTFLCLARRRLDRHPRAALTLLTLAAAISMPLAVRLAQTIPIDSQFLPALLWRQIGAWAAYWIVLAVPFFCAGAAIGLALMLARQRVALVYAANLLGSAAGALLVTPAMYVVPPAWLAYLTGALALPGALAGRRAIAIPGVAIAVALLGVTAWLAPPTIRIDEFKYAAYVQRLARAGEAESIATALSPRGIVALWRSDAFHEIPFLSLDAATSSTPPTPVNAILLDAHWAGALLRADTTIEAEPARHTLAALPYALLPSRPRVLLLGDVGSVNTWTAALEGASEIQFVQPHAELLDLLANLPPGEGGAFLRLPGVRVSTAAPRHFIDHPPHTYDLIQLAEIESFCAGSGSVAGLAENHLVTVEGVRAALDALEPDGLLIVTRAIQSPPRDNPKLLATIGAALRARGVKDPADHVAVVRDFLGVCTMAKPTPWTPAQIERLRAMIAAHNLTPVWFPSIRPDELNHPDALPGPPGSSADWLHHAAVRLLSPDPDDAHMFIDAWAFDVRPPTDARPFFLDFFRLSSIPAMRAAFGDLWLTHAEIAFLFVVGVSAVIGVVALAVTVVPLFILRPLRAARPKLATAVYFGALGLAYLSLEIVVLSRLTHLIGDQVRAASVTIAAFLLFSGIGSLGAQRLITRPVARPWLIVGAVAVVGAANLLTLAPLIHAAGALPLATRIAIGAASVAPMAFLMGFPFPVALAGLDRRIPALVPWAWGVNGFASVLAAPVATAVAMTWSYHATAGAGVGLYLVAALTLTRLPTR